MDNKLNSENGFSLIEVVISLGVLAFGILSLFMLLTSGIRGQTTASRITLAVNEATDQLEELLGKEYDAPELKDVKAEKVANEEYTCENVDHCLAGQSSDYHIFWNVREDYPLENLKTIRVFVEYIKGDKNKVKLEYIKPRSL